MSHDGQLNQELNAVLNLNLPVLINNRKAVLDAFKEIAPILKEAICDGRMDELLEVPVGQSVFKRRLV